MYVIVDTKKNLLYLNYKGHIDVRSKNTFSLATKPSQRSYCKEAIATTPLQSESVFSYLQLFHIRISWELE